MTRVASLTPRPLAPGASPLGAAEPTFVGVLRVPEFRGLWLAQIASLVGDQLAKLALAILIFHRTDSALLSSLAYAVAYLPALLAGPASGLLADVLPRRRVLIACDLARAGVVALMCLPGLPVYVLLILLLVVSSVESPFAAARSALVPDILDGRSYPLAQSLGQVTEQVGQIIGFAVGGVVVGLISARGALAVDVATFLVSAALVVAFVRPRPAPARRGSGSYWHDSAEGARLVLHSPLLRNLVGVSTIGLGLIIATEGLAVAYARQLGHGDVAVGLLAAAVPMGSAVGLALLGRLVRPPRRLATIRLLCVLWPLPLIVTGLRPPVAVTVVLWAVAGALASYQLLANLIFVEGLDPAVRGRAFAFARAAIIAAQGIGLLLAGYLADVLDPATAVALAGIAGLVLCPYFAVSLYPIGRHRAPAAVALDNANDSSSAGSCRQDSMPVPPAGTARLAAAPGQSSAPTNGAAHDQARYRDIPWRSILIYGVSLAILVAVITVTATGVVPNAVDHAPIHLSWWALALIFAFTDLFVVPFQRGSESTVITLSQLPVVLALLLSSPVDLVIGALVGLGVMQFRRWPNLLKCTVNRASEALLAITASGLFYVFRPEQDRGWWLLLAALVATLIADTTSVVFVVIVRRIFDRSVSVFQLLKPLVFSVPTGTAAGTLGLLAVAAMWQRATFGWLLAVVGVLVVAGARSYADLQERHQGLGQLYEFKQQLGPLVTDAAALTPVLERTREILMATRVELSLAAESGPTAASGLHRVLQLDVDGDLVEFWRTEDALPEEDAGRCITVQLAVGTRRLGTLSARDRLGPMRGFRRADLHLLQTLGAQMSDALERGRLIGRLQEAATHDALTGLLRLNELAARLDDELVQGRVFVVVLADVSRLKDVNDSLGREAGDALLRTVADRLREFVPPEALVARSGGGEFAVAIPDLEGFHAGAAVDRLSQLLTGLVQVLGVTVDLRTRLGWAASAQDGRGAATLLRRADLALGVAKRGVEHVQRYRGDMEVDGMRRLRLVNDLRVAIDRREIDVVFQPLVTPRDGVVVGAEALARWTHPELGPLRPDEFIVVAEQSGLIGSLTEVVLDKALAQTQRWERAGRTLRIAVNLSARSLADLSMPGTVVDLLARHRVAPDRLTLEVTETSVAEDPARAEVVLERLRGVGVRLAIDDFGTGYSSLAALKRFPVQEVKLDRQFLVDLEAGLGAAPMATDPNAAAVDIALLTAIVALGHSLNLTIIAEGVETEAAFVRLRDLGVDVLQGYYLGRPGPGSDLLERFDLDARRAADAHLAHAISP